MGDNQNVIDLTADLSEVALDKVIDNKLLKDIPLLGSVINLAQVAYSISDRLFVKKVSAFLTALSDISEEDRQAMLIKISPLSADAPEISEQLIFAIEKIDTISKSRVIAALFRGLIQGKVGSETYMKLVFAVVNSYWADLRKFIISSESEFVVEFDTLVATGLIYTDFTWGQGRGTEKFSPTPLGEKLRELTRPFLTKGTES